MKIPPFRRSSAVQAAAFAGLVGILLLAVFVRNVSPAFLCFAFVALMLAVLYASFEKRRPQARELVPIAVLSAVAAIGRVAFAPFPYVKPVSAIVILAGVALGPQAGFATGATAALVSNFFFGQGPFTPWQMFAWGLMGLAAGALARRGLLQKLPFLCVYGFAACFFYGWIMDVWQLLGYVSPLNLVSAIPVFAASFYFDLTHAVATVVFLLLIAKPWLRVLTRVRDKYGLTGPRA